jgi:hypothetical protein
MNGEIIEYVRLATNIVKTAMDKSLEYLQFLMGLARAKSITVFGPEIQT